MSLESGYSTRIKVPQTQMRRFRGNIKEAPCFEILRLAMEKVVRDRGGRLDNTFTDNEGNTKKCLISIRTDDFQRGVGADIEDDGRLVFRYDTYGDKKEVGSSIYKEINHNYNVIAIMRAQKRLGFNVTVEDRRTSTGRKVTTVKGVR